MAGKDKKTRIAKTSYESKYPYNQAFISEAGHEIHIDNTPGKERIRFAHKKGTYIEISPDGRKVELTVGNKQEYNKGGVTITIDENQDVKTHGHKRENNSGGTIVTVKGDADVVVGGHSNMVVGGNMKAAVAGDAYLGVKGNMNQNIKGNMNMKVAGNMTTETGGTHTIIGGIVSINP
jgi:hypothetical protein